MKTATTYASQSFTKVAPYLLRTEAGQYYGRKKHEGKTHKESLETADFETAKRKLKDFLKRIEKKSVELPDIAFEKAGELWLASLYSLKPASKARRETSLKGILPYFRGTMMRAIPKQDLQEWAAERSDEVTARTFNIDREGKQAGSSLPSH